MFNEDEASYNFQTIQIKTLFMSQNLWNMVDNSYEEP